MKTKNKIRSSNLLGLAVIFFASALAASVPAVEAQQNNSVKANVSLNMPSAVTLVGTDDITTVQNLVLNASNIKFDQQLNASGNVQAVWKGTCNGPGGFVVTVQRSALSGTASSGLLGDLTIRGIPVAGGDRDLVIQGGYAAGKALPAVPESKPEAFAATNGPGMGMFAVELGLASPSKDGNGTANAILTFVGSSL